MDLTKRKTSQARRNIGNYSVHIKPTPVIKMRAISPAVQRQNEEMLTTISKLNGFDLASRKKSVPLRHPDDNNNKREIQLMMQKLSRILVSEETLHKQLLVGTVTELEILENDHGFYKINIRDRTPPMLIKVRVLAC
jgi:hypothetical protein